MSVLDEARSHAEAIRATKAAEESLRRDGKWGRVIEGEIQNEPRPVIGYVRISRDSPASQSIENQRHEIERWVTYKGHRLVNIYEDRDVSGRRHPLDDKRPESKAAIFHAQELAKQKRQPIICCTRIDRFSRRMANSIPLIKTLSDSNIGLVFTQQNFDTDTALGRAALHIHMAFVEAEADTAGERRQKTSIAQQMVGKFVGQVPPYGFRKDHEEWLRINDDEERVMRMARKLADRLPPWRNGGIPYGEISKALNSHGYTTRTGLKWNPKRLRKCMASHGYWMEKISRMAQEGHPAYRGDLYFSG